uniref:TetR family transcriptional regulator C-terminal domain-containing protein n=1 Tax=Cohnella sp. GbtcB17 TaxID=2824762 RepID=UPI0027D222A9
IRQMIKGYVDFNKQLLQLGIDAGEFKGADAGALGMILDGLLFGLSQHARHMARSVALAAYRLAVDVFLHGIA